MREVRALPKLFDPELVSWPIDDSARRRIGDRRLSMLGRTNWKGYPRGFPKLGRTGATVGLLIALPIACGLAVLGLVLSGSPNAAFAFGMTFLAEAGVLAVIFRDRRRSLTRASAAELGHPVCLNCGYYNLGHDVDDSCCECGATMPCLPAEEFPAAEEDETVVDLRRHRGRIPTIRYERH
ncbi:MAG: hypothetical protein CMJ51_05955 [Planctomycetaceae bacterium]|nr:hypothetical protein [Planctomycetaceae bacterium]